MTSYELARNVVVHAHSSGEGGIFANAYLVETRAGVVAIDATLTETESKRLRSELESLRKPLLAVLVTHPHPDHVAGITNLVGTEAPKIFATPSVLALMRRLEEPKREQWAATFGEEWVPRWTYPNALAEPGEVISLEGVTYSVLDVGPGGDSEANSVWVVESPARTAFLGDLVFNGTHSYVADGHLLAWLANLTRLERLCAGMSVAFPGHGAAASPGELFARQREYLLTLASHVKDLAEERPTLTEGAKKELASRMTAQYPQAGLTFLVEMSVDAIARELSGER